MGLYGALWGSYGVVMGPYGVSMGPYGAQWVPMGWAWPPQGAWPPTEAPPPVSLSPPPAGAGPGPAPPGPRRGAGQLKTRRIFAVFAILVLFCSVFARFPPFSPQIRAAPSHWPRCLYGNPAARPLAALSPWRPAQRAPRSDWPRRPHGNRPAEAPRAPIGRRLSRRAGERGGVSAPAAPPLIGRRR